MLSICTRFYLSSKKPRIDVCHAIGVSMHKAKRAASQVSHQSVSDRESYQQCALFPSNSHPYVVRIFTESHSKHTSQMPISKANCTAPLASFAGPPPALIASSYHFSMMVINDQLVQTNVIVLVSSLPLCHVSCYSVGSPFEV